MKLRLIASSLLLSLNLSCDGSSDDNNIKEQQDNDENSGDITSDGPAIDPDAIEEGSIDESTPFSLADLAAYSKKDVLVGLAKNLSIPTHERFAQDLTLLDASHSAHCIAPTDETQRALEGSWRQAMNTFQILDAFKWGPLAEQNDTLRFEIYSWPQTNSCWIDREVIASAGDDYAISTNFNRKGLDALEYLIYDIDLSHSCSAAVPATQGWNELAENDKIDARCRYGALIVDDLINQNEQVLEAWTQAGGTLDQIVNDSVDFDREFNRLTDTLYYLDKQTKDAKLLQPLGIIDNCQLEVCLQKVEHPVSDTSLGSILYNIVGFQSAMEGYPIDLNLSLEEQRKIAPGINALLVASGRSDFVERLTVKTEAAKVLAKQITSKNTRLSEEIKAGVDCGTNGDLSASICELTEKIRQVSNELKTEFAEILSIKVPAAASGDND